MDAVFFSKFVINQTIHDITFSVPLANFAKHNQLRKTNKLVNKYPDDPF